MSWLIQENRDLIRAINSGICGSNSQYPNTSFYSLSSESFAAKCTKGLATQHYHDKTLTWTFTFVLFFIARSFNTL